MSRWNKTRRCIRCALAFRAASRERPQGVLVRAPVDAAASATISVAIGFWREPAHLWHRLGPINKVNQLWAQAKANPVSPVEIPSEAAPVHEIVIGRRRAQRTRPGLGRYSGADLDAGLGQRALHQRSPLHTKDPESGIHNIGTYRAMIKARRPGSAASSRCSGPPLQTTQGQVNLAMGVSAGEPLRGGAAAARGRAPRADQAAGPSIPTSGA